MLAILVFAVAALIGVRSDAGTPPKVAATVAETAGCPPDHTGLRARVERLIQSPSAQAVRQQHGWANVNAANLQVLTDTTVCQWLQDNVTFATTDRITSYYVADGFYFIATKRNHVPQPGTMRLGAWEPVIVIRSDLTFVGSYAS